MEKVIHDPVHGSLRLSGLVLELIDAPEVQRLRGIRQLGLANLVFPGANHSRFEHVLGVSHLVERLGHELELPEEELNPLLAAAVLHDIGHPAYSHTLEYLMKDYLGKDHMEFAGDILQGKAGIYEEELGEIRKLKVPSVVDVLSKHDIPPLRWLVLCWENTAGLTWARSSTATSTWTRWTTCFEMPTSPVWPWG